MKNIDWLGNIISIAILAFFDIANADNTTTTKQPSINLNVKSKEGLEILTKLIGEADVFVQNYRPGALERLGLGYEDVKKFNPGIIYAQVKGFGTGSPWEKSLAFDVFADLGDTSTCHCFNSGVSQGDLPRGLIMSCVKNQFLRGPEIDCDIAGGCFIIDEEVFNYVTFVSKAKDEIIKSK